jgi:hypothetical protein
MRRLVPVLLAVAVLSSLAPLLKFAAYNEHIPVVYETGVYVALLNAINATGGFIPYGEALVPSNNLYDLGSSSTARINLGLGNLATVTSTTGVATALGTNIGSSDSVVINAAGTPGSGSAQNTTANCTASSPTVTLASALDFVNGQGISLEHCGATFTASAPTGLAVSPTGAFTQGPTGSTTYAYQIACVDPAGGVSAAATAVTITNGYATLGTVTQASAEIAFNKVTWITSSCANVAIWRNIASAGYQLIGVYAGGELDDIGVTTVQIPWLPSTPPPYALNDRLVTAISSGAGTDSLVVVGAPTNSARNIYTRHDDTAALYTYLLTTTSATLLPGTYNIESITLPSTLRSFIGYGKGVTTIKGWNISSYTLLAKGMPRGFIISDLTINSVAGGTASPLEIENTSNCVVRDLKLSGNAGLYLYTDTACVIESNYIDGWYGYAIHDQLGINNVIAQNAATAGLQPTSSFGVLIDDTAYDDVHNNELQGGTYFAIDIANGSSNNLVINNLIVASLHEYIHIAGSGSYNRIFGNYIYGNGTSIDYCISLSDDNINSTTQTANSIVGNWMIGCGNSAIVVAQLGGTTPSFTETVIADNTVINSNRIGQALSNAVDIYLEGSAVNATFVNANTFLSGSGTVSYDIAEGTASHGYPTNTQVGTIFGYAGANGTASLSGRGSASVSSPANLPASEIGGLGTGVATAVGNATNAANGLFQLGGTAVQSALSVATNAASAVAVRNSSNQIPSATAPTNSGSCAINTQVGGNTAGSFKFNGECPSAGTVILAFATTAPNGWACSATDTTTADPLPEIAYGATSATFKATSGAPASDQVVFSCVAF